MHKTISIALFVALTMGLSIAVGCSDANASESTYLPIHEACPFGDDDTSSALVPDYNAVTKDYDLDAGVEGFDEAEEGDLWYRDNDEPFSHAAPFMGPTPKATPASAPAEQPAVEASAGGVDINHASADELTELPGIGPALAERIIEYRQVRTFDEAAQLQRVEGIGPATFEQIAPLVEIK